MSEYIHTAIIVSGLELPDEDGIVEALQHATALGLSGSGLCYGRNGFASFMIAPSGSAGGMHASHQAHSEKLAEMVRYLRAAPRPLDWVEVTFGREHGRASIGADCADATSRAADRWVRFPGRDGNP